MNNIKELEKLLQTYLDNFPVKGQSSLSSQIYLNSPDLYHSIQRWLREEHKVIVLPSAMIDPKYSDRILWSINLIEWSRTHGFYMNKNLTGTYSQYYDSYEEALLKGLLQGLEIVKIKVYGITGRKED